MGSNPTRDVEVVVTEIRNGRVKLGVTAPRNAKVLRRELEAVEDLTLVNVSKAAWGFLFDWENDRWNWKKILTQLW